MRRADGTAQPHARHTTLSHPATRAHGHRAFMPARGGGRVSGRHGKQAGRARKGRTGGQASVRAERCAVGEQAALLRADLARTACPVLSAPQPPKWPHHHSSFPAACASAASTSSMSPTSLAKRQRRGSGDAQDGQRTNPAKRLPANRHPALPPPSRQRVAPGQ